MAGCASDGYDPSVLQRLELRHFKSFRRAALDLGPFTLVVGANASGKSNLRDALRVLHGVGLGFSLAEVLGGKVGPGGILQWRGIRGGTPEIAHQGRGEVGLSACLTPCARGRSSDPLEYSLTVDLHDTVRGPRVLEERLSKVRDEGGADEVYDSRPAKQGKPDQLRLQVPAADQQKGRSRILSFPSHSPALRQLGDSGKEPGWLRHPCTEAASAFAAMRFLDLSPDAMREPSAPGLTVLGDRGENLSSVVQAICADGARKAQLLSWVRSLTPMDATDFEFRADLQGRVLLYLREASGQVTSAFNASDGTLRFLALVAALLSPDSGRFYFFEELDTGIHPTRLHLLLSLIQQACRDQGVQVVATTHNPALLTLLDPEARRHAAVAYRLPATPDTRLRRVMELPDAERLLTTQDLGRLFASGWLEDAAVFSEPDEQDEHHDGGPAGPMGPETQAAGVAP